MVGQAFQPCVGGGAFIYLGGPTALVALLMRAEGDLRRRGQPKLRKRVLLVLPQRRRQGQRSQQICGQREHCPQQWPASPGRRLQQRRVAAGRRAMLSVSGTWHPARQCGGPMQHAVPPMLLAAHWFLLWQLAGKPWWLHQIGCDEGRAKQQDGRECVCITDLSCSFSICRAKSGVPFDGCG